MKCNMLFMLLIHSALQGLINLSSTLLWYDIVYVVTTAVYSVKNTSHSLLVNGNCLFHCHPLLAIYSNYKVNSAHFTMVSDSL